MLLLRSVQATDCRTKKEVVPMRHENGAPANHRPLVALSTTLAFLLGSVAVGLLAAVVGPGNLYYWVGTYLVPVMVLLGVVIAVLALLVWALKRLPDPPYRDRWQ
jgi:hypothetical protein